MLRQGVVEWLGITTWTGCSDQIVFTLLICAVFRLLSRACVGSTHTRIYIWPEGLGVGDKSHIPDRLLFISNTFTSVLPDSFCNTKLFVQGSPRCRCPIVESSFCFLHVLRILNAMRLSCWTEVDKSKPSNGYRSLDETRLDCHVSLTGKGTARQCFLVHVGRHA